MKHIILSYSPFTVKFIAANGQEAVEVYNVPLTNAEIRAEYDYIVFPSDQKKCHICGDKATGLLGLSPACDNCFDIAMMCHF